MWDVWPLDRAMEQLYAAFARYPAPSRLSASPYRDAEAILRTLLSAPLRRLDGEQLLPYAGWAMTTVGDADDYRHFLPRILELAIEGQPHLGAEPWVVTGKLDMAGWRGWPAPERSAIEATFRAGWAWKLERTPRYGGALPWLESLAKFGEFEEALTVWHQSRSPYAAEHVAEFVVERGRLLLTRDAPVERTREISPPEVWAPIAAWLRGAEVRRRLDEAVQRADPDVLWTLTSARDIITAADEAT